jgi:hypothetical protein
MPNENQQVIDRFRVNSKFTQNYHVSSPILAGNQVATARGKNSYKFFVAIRNPLA